MKLTFRGWNRQVYSHGHKVSPIKSGSKRRYPLGEPGEPLQWVDAKLARGRVDNLGLTGDFLVDFEFEEEELKNWLLAYAREQPGAAIRLLGEAQAEAIIALATTGKNHE